MQRLFEGCASALAVIALMLTSMSPVSATIAGGESTLTIGANSIIAELSWIWAPPSGADTPEGFWVMDGPVGSGGATLETVAFNSHDAEGRYHATIELEPGTAYAIHVYAYRGDNDTAGPLVLPIDLEVGDLPGELALQAAREGNDVEIILHDGDGAVDESGIDGFDGWVVLGEDDEYLDFGDAHALTRGEVCLDDELTFALYKDFGDEPNTIRWTTEPQVATGLAAGLACPEFASENATTWEFVGIEEGVIINTRIDIEFDGEADDVRIMVDSAHGHTIPDGGDQYTLALYVEAEPRTRELDITLEVGGITVDETHLEVPVPGAPEMPEQGEGTEWAVKLVDGDPVVLLNDEPVDPEAATWPYENADRADIRLPEGSGSAIPWDAECFDGDMKVDLYLLTSVPGLGQQVLVAGPLTLVVGHDLPRCSSGTTPPPVSDPDEDEDTSSPAPDAPRQLPTPPAAALEPTTEGAVHRLYLGVFGRIADEGGLAYWAAEYDSGRSAASIALAMIHSPEGRQVFGTEPTAPADEELLDRLYRVLFGREPDAGGRAYWLDQIATRNLTEGHLIAQFATSPEMAKLIEDAFAD